ncbi:BolA family protein [Haemophilus influenzae]|uniref:BolA family protein n=1 Tax=Haemophilus influenzae TaxID=727 RepID=UPI00014F8593|nr:BolA family transcriptional regulator [Haemophilus influenzae]EDJ88618.1 glutathione reductase [Haemophilus influenzae 22.1-21]MCK8802982.1 BolA family transcriptional regulator [Haemophilus influenzae]MCK8886314.1 BolA family transcriptional regulator [Haemophilus influenzae]MCK9055257.1 BolA family transcriptional regulator [Haemophilus influenzae]MCK9146605.1 BolA family transcriptional regulator [Haemophilus influenzae]
MSIQQIIEQKIQKEFQPHFLAIENESHLHHSNRGSESHFKCVIVSADFKNIRKVQRHQRIYQLLNEELNHSIHALALHLFTPEEWKAQNEAVPHSTKCAGIGR